MSAVLDRGGDAMTCPHLNHKSTVAEQKGAVREVSVGALRA
jgi:hypothetical protein